MTYATTAIKKDVNSAPIPQVYSPGGDEYVPLLSSDPDTATAETTVSILATSTTVLAANADRVYARFINDSDTTIYLREGAAAVVGEGTRLNANGGSYEMYQAACNLYRGAIYGIAAAAGGKDLLVGERE